MNLRTRECTLYRWGESPLSFGLKKLKAGSTKEEPCGGMCFVQAGVHNWGT